MNYNRTVKYPVLFKELCVLCGHYWYCKKKGMEKV